MKTPAMFLSVSVLSLGVVACGVESEEPDIVVTNVPKIAMNGAIPSDLPSLYIQSNVRLGIAGIGMDDSVEGRRVLAYIVSCALPAGSSVAMMGGTGSYAGGMGVAPGWISGGLTATEASNISACLYARINLSGKAVELSMRGESSVGFATTATERQTYGIEEGAFWGNIFSDLGRIEASACNGVDQLLDDSHDDLPLRECAEEDGATGKTPCGFTYRGACEDVCDVDDRRGYRTYANCAGSGPDVATTFLLGA